MTPTVRRRAQAAVEAAMGDTPVVLIHGPRQSGKSTLAHAVCPDLAKGNYVTLDHPDAFSLANTDPMGFLSSHKPPIVIDEVQRAPGLFLPLKLVVDRERRPGMFLLTGSANILTLPKLADSLAGRMEVVELLPFSQGELDGSDEGFLQRAFADDFDPPKTAADPEDLIARIVKGSFPEPALRPSPARRAAWYAGYVKTLLERDVRDIANIEALPQLPRLLRLLAGRAGTVLNVSSLATDIGIPYTSLKRYLSLLESVFLLQLVPAWSMDSPGKLLTKAPKAYLIDTGLLCHLANLDEAGLRRDPERLGPLLENFVAMELRKQIAAADVKPWLLHLRTIRHLEVDFILESPQGDVVGLAVRAAEDARLEDAAGLKYLQELAGERFRRGFVLHMGREARPLAPGIFSMPIAALWRS